MSTRSFLAVATVTTAVGLLLSGCAQVYPGGAERDAGYDANAVNPALLDTGNYSTQPRAALGNAGDAKTGAILEGHRLADNVVLPVEVDPTLSHVGAFGNSVVASPEAVGVFLENDGFADAAQANNYITGYVRQANYLVDSTQNLYLQNAVLEFKTDADATAAATAMAQEANTHSNPVDKTPVPVSTVSVPGHPATLARSWVQSYDGLGKTNYSVVAFTPHGRFVIFQSAFSIKDLPTTAALVAATLDKQIPLLDAFTPTAPDQLVNLPQDPSGLRVRVLAPTKSPNAVQYGNYGPYGALAFQSDPLTAQKKFDEFGVDLLIYEDTFLTRLKDADNARRFLEWDLADQAASGWTPIDGIPGLPGAHCMSMAPTSSSGTTEYWCALAEDRLVLETTEGQEVDAKQKLAAGYLMLTAK